MKVQSESAAFKNTKPCIVIKFSWCIKRTCNFEGQSQISPNTAESKTDQIKTAIHMASSPGYYKVPNIQQVATQLFQLSMPQQLSPSNDHIAWRQKRNS